jgi:hypothetical protein
MTPARVTIERPVSFFRPKTDGILIFLEFENGTKISLFN